MKTISIINLKGGTGKTTTVVNLAYLLREKGNRVLVIDNDKQSNATKLFLTKNFNSDEEYGLYEMLMSEKSAIECIHQSRYGVDVVPSSIKLRVADIRIETTMVGKEKYTILREKLDEIKSNYDYILIDNPPDINSTVFNAIATSDDVIITVNSSSFDVDGAKNIKELVQSVNEYIGANVRIKGVLQTNVGRNKISKLSRELMRDLGYKLFNTYIRSSCKVSEASGMYKPLEVHAPNSPVAEDYRQFLEEYLETN